MTKNIPARALRAWLYDTPLLSVAKASHASAVAESAALEMASAIIEIGQIMKIESTPNL